MLRRKYIVLSSIGIVSILLGSLFYYNIVQGQGVGDYNPWCDINDDGKIDMQDIATVARKFGTSGEPINKTALLLELLDKIESLNNTVIELENTVHYLNTTIINLNETVVYLNETVVYINATGLGVPIGSIIPWAKNLAGIPAIPENFVECNGQTLDDAESPLDGQTIPNLNAGRFLRGNSVSGSTGGSATHAHSISVPNIGEIFMSSTVKGHPGYTEPASNVPPYYDVVWIMRVK